jgi:hypothetical protein
MRIMSLMKLETSAVMTTTNRYTLSRLLHSLLPRLRRKAMIHKKSRRERTAMERSSWYFMTRQKSIQLRTGKNMTCLMN